MSKKLPLTLTESEVEAMAVLLRDVELLHLFVGGSSDIEMPQIITDLIAIRDKIVAAEQPDPWFDCSVEYFNGERWAYLTHPKRFWERRRFASREAAQQAINAAMPGPGFVKCRIMKKNPTWVTT